MLATSKKIPEKIVEKDRDNMPTKQLSIKYNTNQICVRWRKILEIHHVIAEIELFMAIGISLTHYHLVERYWI